MCCLTLSAIPECLSPGETPGVHTARPQHLRYAVGVGLLAVEVEEFEVLSL